MSSLLTGGGGRAAYRLESLNLDCIKSPSSAASWNSNSSSPSSTLSESTNLHHLTISTRKPRTPRKRPNQTYNEAATILSTAYPKIFPTKHITKPRSKLNNKSKEENNKSNDKNPFPFEPSDLLMPFQVIDNSDFLINLERPHLPKGFNPFEKSCLSPGEINSQGQCSSEICEEYLEGDFDAESMLDEEIGEGIDSIMGNTNIKIESNEDLKNYTYNNHIHSNNTMQVETFAYGYPVGLGFDYNFGMKREFRAIRNVDEGDGWRFPCVNVVDLNPNISDGTKTVPTEKIKKKKKKVENKKSLAELVAKENSNSWKVKAKNEKLIACIKPPPNDEEAEEAAVPQLANAKLILKLNYDDVLNTWADKASPFSGDELTGNDVQARLAQIDLFSENGGIREASVLRYKEKRRTRLFSKKIRYQVRKVNADRRPRMKGRFVRTPNSPEE